MECDECISYDLCKQAGPLAKYRNVLANIRNEGDPDVSNELAQKCTKHYEEALEL